jgi:hypothetical protein
MGKEKPGDSHPIISEWGGAWVVPGQSMGNLRCNFFFMSPELSLILAYLTRISEKILI